MVTTLQDGKPRLDVFTYGSLMFPPVWERVVRGQYRSEPAVVRGFRRVCVRDKEHPALVVAAAAAPAIEGRIYRGVDAADLARLDHFETAAYARVSVAATVGSETVPAQTYLALNIDQLLLVDWDLARFERDGLPVFLRTYAVQNAPPD